MQRPMTPRGNNKLRAEVQKLRATRPELAKAIEIARAHGDISENADYDAAKEKSGMVEAKIRDIEVKLTEAQVIDPLKIGSHEKIVFGLSTKVLDIDTDEEKIFHIVGGEESDLSVGRISFESAVGRALIGRVVGEVATVTLPAGKREYEVLEIFCGYEAEATAVE